MALDLDSIADLLDDEADSADGLGDSLIELGKAAIEAKTGVQKYKEEIRDLQRTNSILESTISDLREQLERFGDTEYIEQLENTVERTKNQFKEFIKVAGLSMDSVSDDGWGTISDVFASVKEGASTYVEAITQVKSEYQALLRDMEGGIDEHMFAGLSASLKSISELLDTVIAKVDDLAENGVKAIAVEPGPGGGGSQFVDFLENISTATSGLSDEAKAAYEPLTNLVNAMKGFADLDTNALYSISSAFSALSNIGKGTFGDQKVSQLVDMVIRLKEAAAGGFGDFTVKLSGLEGFKNINATNVKNVSALLEGLNKSSASIKDLGEIPNVADGIKKILSVDPSNGINNLKVSKASLNNLATYLPVIEKVNDEKIRGIFAVDTSGINSLKVSKASITNVENLARAVQILRENNVDLTLQGNATEDLKNIAESLGLTEGSADRASNAIDNVGESIRNVANDASNLGKEASKALEPLNGIAVKRPSISDFKGSIRDTLRDSYNMPAEDINKVTEALGVQEGQLADVTAAYQRYIDGNESIKHVSSVTVKSVRDVGDGIKKVSTSIAEFNPIRDDDNNIINWSISIARGYERIAVAAKQAKDETDKLADKSAALDALDKLQLKINSKLDDAMGAGVESDNDAVVSLQTLLDVLASVEDQVANGSFNSQSAFNDVLREANGLFDIQSSQLSFAIKQQKDYAKAEAEAVKVQESRARIIAELNRIQSVNMDAAKNGVSSDAYSVQQVEEYAEKLYELESRLSEAKMTQKEFNEELAKLQAEYKADVLNVQNMTKAQKEQNTHIAKGTKVYEQAGKALKDYEGAQNDSSEKVRESYEAISTLQKRLSDAADKYRSGEMNTQQYDDAVKQATADLKEHNDVLKAAGYGVEGTSSKFAELTQQLTRFITPLYLARKAWQTVKEMANTVIELEDAFASLQIVTGATDRELDRFYETAVNIANSLGKSITDIAGSIEVFSRLGYSLSEATSLAEQATVLSNVARVTADEATTGLTSIIKGYNMHVENAEHVADVLINIGQKYAVSAGELMEAYEKSGAALAATNTSFEKSAALIAAANAAVQNSSVVGTALKTVSARIRGSKDDLKELGEDTDELVNGFSKYAEELKALTGFDIMVEGTTDKFKDLYDIMEGVASVWDNLTDTQQARTAEILGGTRQLQVIASILRNWGDAQNAYADAQNSAGEAARANSIYMDTTTAHINQFKAAFQDLSHTVIDSGLLKNVVDLGTALLNMADGIAKFISSAGGLAPIITSLASLALIFNGANIVSALVKVGGTLTGVIAGVKTGIGAILASAKGLTGVVTTLDVVSAGTATAASSMTAMASGLGVVILAASALAAVISKVNYELAQQREAAMQAGDSAAAEGNALVELVDKYRELNETGASNDEIIAAREEIADKLGMERGEVEKLTREYGRFEEQIQKLTKAELERQRVTLQGAMNAAKESLTSNGYEAASARRTINYGKEDADSNSRAISSLQDRGFISRSSTGSQGSILNYDLGDLSSYEGVLDAFDRLHQMMNTLIADGNANNAVYQDIFNLYNQLKVGVDAYNNALSNLLTNELQQQYIANGIPKTASDYATMRAEMIAAVAASNDLGMSVEDATSAVDDFLSNQPGLSQFSTEVNNAFNSISSGADAIALARSQFESMKNTFDDVTNSLKGITDVQAVIADGFVVDAQKAMELAEAYPGILDNATITADGQIKLNEDVANSFIDGKESEIKAALTAKIADLEGDRAILVAKRDMAQAQLEMANQVAQGKSKLSVDELQNELNNQNAVTQALIQMGMDEAEAYRAVLKAMNDNTVTFDGNVADTAQNIANNMASASSSMATSFNANVKLMNVGMGILVGNAHQVATAVDAMGKGKIAGAIGYTDGGGNGQSINTFNRSFNQRSFGGVGVSYTPRTVQLNSIINQLDTDISGYTSAINAIDSQISALYTILNSSLGSINSNRTGGGGGGGGSGGSGGGGGGGGGGSGSGSSAKEETWFEKQYKLHQHYLNMDQETTEDFLKWLEKAYKQAYKEGIITLDEYYKYEEEIYKTYQKIKEAAKATFDALVDYRVKMLKQERQNEKEALNDKLSDLKEYYSKQKELLQKQADESKYIDEQSEKRKNVNDIKQQIAQLQFDTSAWAQKRREELLQQLSDAEKELQDFEDQHALEEALNALDEAYNAEEEKMNKQIEAIDDLLNDPEALYNQALSDIKGNTEDLFKAFLLFNKKYGDGDDETIIKMWEEAFKNSEAFKSIYGSYYNDTQIGNYTGYTAPTPPTNPTPPAPSSGNSGGSSSSSSSSSKSSAPSLAAGSTVQVKTSATHFSPKSGSVRMASFVPGGKYTVYQTSGNEVLIGRNGVYTGWIYKTDIVGYKKGTKNATPGLHKVNEEGTEAIFSSSDGQTYRMFNGGEKVLNAKATNFLYEFAMAGADILDKMRGQAKDTFRSIGTVNQPIDITMGDIIINGEVSQQSVSDIRRAQREQINDVLKAFNRYQITLYRATK